MPKFVKYKIIKPKDTPTVTVRTDRCGQEESPSEGPCVVFGYLAARFTVVTAEDMYRKSRPDIKSQVKGWVEDKVIQASQQYRMIARMYKEEWSKLTDAEKSHWKETADKVNENYRKTAPPGLKQDVAISTIQKMQDDVLKEFGFPTLCVVFTPSLGSDPAKATVLDPWLPPSVSGPHFTRSLMDTHGKPATNRFLNHFGEYATFLYGGNGSVGIGSNAIWRENIRVIPKPKGLDRRSLIQLYSKGMFDRFVTSGHSVMRMPWSRVEAHPDHYLLPNALPDGLEVKFPHNCRKAELEKVVQFFYDHQEGKVAWEDGLVFK
ncbi:hypothetical protein FRC17_005202 [Serendipita sp. 399]|nr:hypothetical protein FRC17_005202 [Serendipita sp. 399]